jgi:hypothetical protein
MGLKVELINGAYSRMRISGVTSKPTSGDLAVALRRMERMAAAWELTNICTNYNFEDTPDLNSVSNVELGHEDAFETSLAMRLLSDFGKMPAPTLVKDAKGAFSVLLSSTATTNQVAYPNRQPVGSGNSLRRNRFQRYYTGGATAPNTCATNRMIKDDIDIFTEHFDDWLGDTETLVSYTAVSNKPSNLFLSNDSLSGADVTYTIEAKTAGVYVVTIVVTSSLGRVKTEIVYFEIAPTTEGP